ncbi:MAG: MFS transporter [Bacteroidota bacterium]|jgi:MFS family permease
MENGTRVRWLNRTVLGIGIASFFSDLGHETATAILPAFLASIGAAPFALGVIEGVSDAIASFSKLGSGWYSDRLRSRKSLAVSGYFLTGAAGASFAFASSWLHVLAGRTVGWFGRGIRGPVRDAIMADAIPPEASGRAFGFDRALDTLGAVLGPVVALWLVAFASYRNIFLITFIPGVLAALSFAFIVKEKRRDPAPTKGFSLALKQMPPVFRRFLLAVGIFGMGDFAHTLLILRATQILSGAEYANPVQLGVTLYIIHNIVYAVASYPAGALGDKIGKRRLLALGYGLSALMCVGFVFVPSNFLFLVILFMLGGMFIAIEDSLERALAADMLPQEIRGTGFGVLAAVNGVGDFVSSIMVGFLWASFSPAGGFLYAGALSLVGMTLMLRLKTVR